MADEPEAGLRLKQCRALPAGAASPWLAGTLHSEIARARSVFRDQPIAARGAADAVIGVAEALTDYVCSEPGMPVDSEQMVLPLSAPSVATP